MKLKINFIVVVIALLSFGTNAQTSDSRFAIETTLEDKATVVYEENRGALKLNSSTGELIFITNLANFQTGNKTIDSLVSEQKIMLFTFNANIGQNIPGLMDEQNDDKYHAITGIVTVNNLSYNTEAFIRLKNLSEKSNLSKVLVDLKLEIDPKIVKLPYLSDYFKNVLLFQIDDSYFNQNK